MRDLTNQPLRVLHVIGATVAGGAEVIACGLARELAACGLRMGVFALSGNVDAVGQRMRERLADSGVFFASGPTGRVRFGAVWTYAAALRRFAPDIVHLHTPNTELAHALVGRLGTARAARTVHNTVMSRRAIQRWAWRRNRVSVSIACSAAVAQANRDWAEHTIVVINGVDFSWPQQSPQVRQAAAAKLGLAGTTRHFAMIGGMRGDAPASAQKAHDVAIAAWRAAQLDPKRHVLHLIGDGPLRPHLERLAHDVPGIVFHGVSAQVADWLCLADVFVMPSRYEGLPLAGIEALGTGLACIFSDIPPLRELNPSSALWCAPNDVTALAHCLRSAAECPAEFKESNPSTYRARYGMGTMAQRYREYYAKLIE